MADVTIKIGSNKPEEQFKVESNVKVSLNMRKTLDNNLLIFDHMDIDIAIIPEKQKIVTFPKEQAKDDVYNIQDKFFKFLTRKGVIMPETIQGGNIFGSLEAQYPLNEQVDEVQAVVLTISKFIQEEKPHMLAKKEFEDMEDERLLEPDEIDSTELGEVPHENHKGSISPHHRYGMLYRYFEE